MFIGLFSLEGRTIQICPSCTTSGIAEAVDLAKDGDVLNIQKGTYFEHGIIIDKSLKRSRLDPLCSQANN